MMRLLVLLLIFTGQAAAQGLGSGPAELEKRAREGDEGARLDYGRLCWRSPAACRIEEGDRTRIVGVVLLTFAMTEKCGADHSGLRPQIGKTLGAWRTRNFSYVEFALADPQFVVSKAGMLGRGPQEPIAQAQCEKALASLDKKEVDFDYLRSQAR